MQKTVILITGSSTGIGLETANFLATKGFTVYGASRKKPTQTVQFQYVHADVNNEDSCKLCVQSVIDKEGQIDVLINNAGFGLLGGGEESSIKQALDVFNTNFFGVMRMSRATLPYMRERKNGRIINVSSILGRIPAPFYTIYCASKHAVEGYSESLDHEIRGFGVRSLLIEPGLTKTNFDSNIAHSDETLQAYSTDKEKMIRAMEKALREADEPKAVAETILKAITSKTPQLRYPVGSAKSLSRLRQFMPSSVFDSAFHAQWGLG